MPLNRSLTVLDHAYKQTTEEEKSIVIKHGNDAAFKFAIYVKVNYLQSIGYLNFIKGLTKQDLLLTQAHALPQSFLNC